ncbi:hypothetical protein LF1_34020 [Rubripirellula obstinata]|uniref:VapC45 PIN like domain-containing protein n=1 Tax=Rubripirellula obstinata TaxID=406547 RepID=A0A5B1CMR1_9BACT|nr:hypothetical protein LF1_34020 [Rubripirellula obstinata]
MRTALEDVGAIVQLHTDHFEQDAEDQHWLPIVGQRGWIVLTKDRHILVNQIEVVALLRSGTASFILKSADMTGKDMGQAFAKAHTDMVRMIQRKPMPFIATITKAGTVKYVHGYDGLQRKLRQ